MNPSKILPDDPRLTAYALGELEGDDRVAVEAALRDDPAVQAAVAEIRSTVVELEAALATESMEPVAAAARTAPREPKGKLLHFPQLYYLVGGLAAACFAVMVALRPAVQPKVYKEVALVAVPESKPAEPPVAAVASKDERIEPPVAVAMAAPVMAPPPPAPAPAMMVSAVQVAQDSAEEQSAQVSQRRGEDKLKKEVMAQSSGRMRPSAARPMAKAAGMAMVGNRLVLDANVVTGTDNAPAMNTGAYAYRRDNDFLGAAENPRSTFSVDVDTASYSNVRRFIRNGQLPPPDAVRVEEMVNYFPYHYAAPTGDVPFAAMLEVAEAPWAPTHRLVRIGLKGREVATAARPAANLVFLLDMSGSMDEPNKLPLVKEAMRLLVGKLRPDDRVAIVVYAGASGLALPSTPVAKARQILAALEALTPGGATNGAMGLRLAYDIAKANFVPGGVNRVILCTDGDFNVGVTNDSELTRLITEQAKSGVCLTALGFGMGNYKDATLEQLADRGNGNYGYIDTRREAEKLLVEQVNGTLVTIAKDVKLQVEFNPARVASYRLIGYENRLLKSEDFNNDAVDAGEIGAGHTVTALYEVVPVGAEEKAAVGGAAVDPLKYQAVSGQRSAISSASRELLTLKVRYKQPAGDVSRKLEFPLVDGGGRFAAASGDFKLAAAVAEFGMILRDSPHKGAGTLDDVIAWADAGTEGDAGGYRGEFTELVRQAGALTR